MGYPNRRYRVVDGKLEKVWTGTNDPGWFVNKADAWAAVAAPVAVQEPAGQPEGNADDSGYEAWKGPALRKEIKARTGKGLKPGAESTKAAMVARLRDLDLTGWPVPPEMEPKSDGKPVVVPPAETEAPEVESIIFRDDGTPVGSDE